MKTFLLTLKRNVKMFFKDKGLFFTSLITPLILLLLYATFLSNVYKNSVNDIFSNMGIILDSKILNGIASGQLISSLLAVSCVTVSFCSNMLMVQDKVSGARTDMLISPVKPHTLAFSYYFATFVSTLIISLVATVVGIVYVKITGWYMSFGDILLVLLDVLMLVTFGTALSSVINFFLSSQGQISAVGSIVSSCYGFICGAYMPLSSFSEGLRNVLMFLPGTYGTSLLRNHALRGVLEELSTTCPQEAVNGLKDAIDCNIYFFDTKIQLPTMYIVMIATIALLIVAYVLMNVFANKKNK